MTNSPPPRPMMPSTAALESTSPAALAQATNGLSGPEALTAASLLRALDSEQPAAPLAAPASSPLMATISTGACQ